ncbi:pro-corazonin [Stomoxys calcitrans]|uniref:Pro-corazonin n=1 Tax=Stomoxys calcitrans TaxID=35570 RepID=A0A1I8PSS7_STOCA|nr:pro-corazonin [Stomoxys calcitrans]XP_013102494.1 pro-corazonin [Stomoxys calcitrans]
MLRIVLLLFLFSMACMGQTFQYSRGWTNGKRSGGGSSTSNIFRKDDEGMSELFDFQDVASERRLERCLLQLQHVVRNPLLLHSAAAALALNPLTSNNVSGNRNNNLNKDSTNNPFSRSHQSNELFEEVIDANDDYGKH